VLVEVAVAFVLIFTASSLLYMVGRRTSFKSKHSVDGQLTYACGEKTTPQRLTINISLYKYLSARALGIITRTDILHVLTWFPRQK
jgi:hypothetical protein